MKHATVAPILMIFAILGTAAADDIDDGRFTLADEVGGLSLGQVDEIRFESFFDGREIQGWIVTPPAFDPATKVPLILEIHRGNEK